MTDAIGKKYTRGSINAKLSRGILTFHEFETIAKKYAGYGDFNRYKSYIKRAGRYVINRLNDFGNDISKKAR